MSSIRGFRGRLVLQALLTTGFAMTGSSVSSGWTLPTLLVAAAGVFVGLAMRPEPRWRGYVVGFEGVAVAYGLVALVAGHYVPGTLVAGYTLARLLSAEAAGAFAGTPTWAPPLPAAQPTAQPVALAPVYPSEPAYLPPPVPVAAVPAPVPAPVPVLPQQPLAPRQAAMTVLPGR
ncbi:MAG: hypothetical protein JWP14_612 [Frankiales bacterium]|nr:hypothetical protein [Frankiales bacterium]